MRLITVLVVMTASMSPLCLASSDEPMLKSTKLVASIGAWEDYFGGSVAVEGDVAVVGAFLEDDYGEEWFGGALVFERQGSRWVEAAKLSNWAPRAVSVSGDVVAIGVPDGGEGTVHLVERKDGTWEETGLVVAADGRNGDKFGWSVAIDEEVLVVGAVRKNEGGDRAGAAYVYELFRGSWVETAKLVASDGEAWDRFGWSVAVSGNVIVVGAPYEDEGGNRAGAAYVFELLDGEWVETAKLNANDAAEFDDLGRSVAVSGKTIVLGAQGKDEGSNWDANIGAAYVFEQKDGSWEETAKLSLDKPEQGDLFGRAVAVSGDTIAVGASGENDAAGAVHVFQVDGDGEWVEAKNKTRNPEGTPKREFGRSVSISGDVIAVGAPGDGEDGLSAGSAFIFTLPTAFPFVAALAAAATVLAMGAATVAVLSHRQSAAAGSPGGDSGSIRSIELGSDKSG